jgi:hypothetical protein
MEGNAGCTGFVSAYDKRTKLERRFFFRMGPQLTKWFEACKVT